MSLARTRSAAGNSCRFSLPCLKQVPKKYAAILKAVVLGRISCKPSELRQMVADGGRWATRLSSFMNFCISNVVSS